MLLLFCFNERRFIVFLFSAKPCPGRGSPIRTLLSPIRTLLPPTRTLLPPVRTLLPPTRTLLTRIRTFPTRARTFRRPHPGLKLSFLRRNQSWKTTHSTSNKSKTNEKHTKKKAKKSCGRARVFLVLARHPTPPKKSCGQQLFLKKILPLIIF